METRAELTEHNTYDPHQLEILHLCLSTGSGSALEVPKIQVQEVVRTVPKVEVCTVDRVVEA